MSDSGADEGEGVNVDVHPGDFAGVRLVEDALGAVVDRAREAAADQVGDVARRPGTCALAAPATRP